MPFGKIAAVPGFVILAVALSTFLMAAMYLLRDLAGCYSDSINLTVSDLISLSEEISTSADQLQKAYDWTINQWSNFGNALLVATLGFVSACIIEVYKDSIKVPHIWIALIVGVVLSTTLYMRCQIEIRKLRNEFMSVYALLAELKP